MIDTPYIFAAMLSFNDHEKTLVIRSARVFRPDPIRRKGSICLEPSVKNAWLFISAASNVYVCEFVFEIIAIINEGYERHANKPWIQ